MTRVLVTSDHFMVKLENQLRTERETESAEGLSPL